MRNGYRGLAGWIKLSEHGFDHPASSSDEVKSRLELYFYSPALFDFMACYRVNVVFYFSLSSATSTHSLTDLWAITSSASATRRYLVKTSANILLSFYITCSCSDISVCEIYGHLVLHADHRFASSVHSDVTYSIVIDYQYIHNYTPIIKSHSQTTLAKVSGATLSHYRAFTINLGRTTLGKLPLDERSARRRDFYLTTYNTPKGVLCVVKDVNP